MKKHAYLSIDFGNSSTRITVRFEEEAGKWQTRIKTISNRYGMLEDKRLHLTEYRDYTDRNSKVLYYDGDNICIGKICSSECGSNIIKPTATDKKFNSKFTKYAIRFALIEGYMILADMLGCSIEDLDVVWHMAACLPAYDLEMGTPRLQEMILEVTELDFKLPNFKKKIEIDPTVIVRPEGYTAFVGTIFEQNNENKMIFRYQMKPVATTNVLVVDMGDGTTDLCRIKDAVLSEDSLHSISMGGSTVTNNLKKNMEQRFGKRFSLDTIQDATITGELRIGNQVKDVTKEVEAIRKRCAIIVANEIKGYFDSLSIPIDEIQYILLCGGGAEKSESPEMKSYAEFVKQELHNMMQYADFLEMPKIKLVNKGNEELVPLNPRLLNVIGLGILNSPKKK